MKERKWRIGLVNGFSSLAAMLSTLPVRSSHERKYDFSPSYCEMYRPTQRRRLSHRVVQCFSITSGSDVKSEHQMSMFPFAAMLKMIKYINKELVNVNRQ